MFWRRKKQCLCTSWKGHEKNEKRNVAKVHFVDGTWAYLVGDGNERFKRDLSRGRIDKDTIINTDNMSFFFSAVSYIEWMD